MLAIISPAKSLDFDSKIPISNHTQARLLPQAEELIKECRKLSPEEIGNLMKISPKLAQLNYERFLTWQLPFSTDNAKQAIFVFNGDVYTGLDIQNLPTETIKKTDSKLRILSGLYGLLRPFDLIQPYRLEMGSKLTTKAGNNLYNFWGDTITQQLNSDLKEEKTSTLINLASNEYFKVINKKQLQAEIITPIFKDYKDGKLKIISFYAKKARGMMVRFLLEKSPKTANELKEFNAGGYVFDENLSNGSELVFTR